MLSGSRERAMSPDQFSASPPPRSVAAPTLEAPVPNLNPHTEPPTTPPVFHGLLAMDITDEDVKPIIVDSLTPPKSGPKSSVSIDVAIKARSGLSSAPRPNDRSFLPGPYDPTEDRAPSKSATLAFRRSSLDSCISKSLVPYQGSFSQYPELAKKRRHTLHGTTRYNCNECLVGFRRKADWIRHMENAKAHKSPAFQCDRCKRCYSREDALARHVRVACRSRRSLWEESDVNGEKRERRERKEDRES
ncbi:hypothetical protein HETIRDRAFT_321726 [Heterobasidion irregulare TC 32-1]|uniref:C2H2-type domain-containing protein n=1 Tax=Heterobasidion irregulare (strain TC 32-1) TaxID=747525 RepID=W4K0W2_HETIT|nr:uncharacterized protein HETIRDRAFT_321726 [Heterobasidion irregulare TC 32-1]ETW79468.1 hypothetical protein HETIRDRAFT_321726 [Heterobasidion irregulare TC 32-1]